MDWEPQRAAPDADAEVMRGLFEAHFDELCRFAYRYLGHVEEAREVVQDVLLRAWETRDAVPLHAGMRTYLYTLVRNRALDQLRHRQVRRRPQPQRLAEWPGFALSAEELFVSAEVAQQIGDAVAALPARQREIIGLRWREGASYKQIAAQLGIAEKTVGNHIQRAMGHLRDSLKDLTNN